MTATDMADYLVRQSLPFRAAHEVVGKVVRYCLEKNKELYELGLEELKAFSPLFSDDVFQHLTPEHSVNNKAVIGGTAREEVLKRLNEFE